MIVQINSQRNFYEGITVEKGNRFEGHIVEVGIVLIKQVWAGEVMPDPNEHISLHVIKAVFEKFRSLLENCDDAFKHLKTNEERKALALDKLHEAVKEE